MPSLLRQLEHDGRSSEKGSKKMESSLETMRALNHLSKVNVKASSSSSKARENAHREFLAATSKSWGRIFSDHRDLPDLETAFSSFKEIYPRYCETLAIESLRTQEYDHLVESGRVCLDYCGFGLFSYVQQFDDWESAAFALSSLSVNLCAHALFGAAKEGTTEYDIRKRIMDYLNIQDDEYSMVFTASRGASFKLLGDAYPFSTAKRLVTMYDYESESLDWLVQHAKDKGAKVSNVSFKWPSLRVVSTRLRQLLIAKGRRRKRGSATGLFVFPVQSRVSGAKYSYQWMSLAQQNKWHVLLDASALGPKEMHSLGLSMFKPDFIIASFYKVFGADPSGFGCLFIKNSAMQAVQSQSGDAAPGIVRIISFPTTWSSSELSVDSNNVTEGPVVSADGDEEDASDFEFPKSSQLIQVIPSFSGPMLGFGKFSSPDGRSGGAKHEREEDDDDSSVCDSAGGVSQSPVFSEEGVENLFCLDVGTSAGGSASRASLSDDQFSGPFSGPIHNPAFDGQLQPNGPRGLQNPLYDDDSSFNLGTMSKEKVESLSLVNGKHDCVTYSIKGLSKSAEEGHLPLSNGDSERKAQDLCSFSEASKEQVSTPRGENVNDTERDAYSSFAVLDCQHLQLQSHQIDIEMTENSMHRDQAKEITEEKCPCTQNESAIRRETEGDFRLLGRRGSSSRPMCAHAFSPLQGFEDFDASRDRSFMYVEQVIDSCHSNSGSSNLQENKYVRKNEGSDEQDLSEDEDPKVVCRCLDHADMLGLNKTALRHRYLINWLVSSLLQLRHPGEHKTTSLVCVYGPQIKYDRGASIAFNLYDCNGKLIHPELVQMLADTSNISLSIGFLKNLQISENDPDLQLFEESRKLVSRGISRAIVAPRMEVVTAALSILSSFEDVYKLWLFVARFLEADFAQKELSGSQEALITQDR